MELRLCFTEPSNRITFLIVITRAFNAVVEIEYDDLELFCESLSGGFSQNDLRGEKAIIHYRLIYIVNGNGKLIH